MPPWAMHRRYERPTYFLSDERSKIHSTITPPKMAVAEMSLRSDNEKRNASALNGCFDERVRRFVVSLVFSTSSSWLRMTSLGGRHYQVILIVPSQIERSHHVSIPNQIPRLKSNAIHVKPSAHKHQSHRPTRLPEIF